MWLGYDGQISHSLASQKEQKELVMFLRLLRIRCTERLQETQNLPIRLACRDPLVVRLPENYRRLVSSETTPSKPCHFSVQFPGAQVVILYLSILFVNFLILT